MPSLDSAAAVSREFVLTLTCPDTRGIVHAVSGYLVERECNILDSTQYGDLLTGTFVMRIHFAARADESVAALRRAFAPVAARFRMDCDFHDLAIRPRVLILVSRQDHCLNDLLYRHRIGDLKMDVPKVVSNHRDVERLVTAHDIPFEHLPVSPPSKAVVEQRLLEIVAVERVDFVVLARYMQVLSPAVCAALPGRIINIHHSFLPGFKGARPYHQAYERGVKLIGATAHYVTPDLDEGPILEQDVARVDHSMDAAELEAVGRTIEQNVLANAVRWQIEQRVLRVGARTIVFR
ncbi:MAG TPA: formyltetrahydrofolate deformylase [Steroidobacteraceae bacterium]|nr:formyltetrahydrofolate deformylase [Steroidobacteraceae bacterium]